MAHSPLGPKKEPDCVRSPQAWERSYEQMIPNATFMYVCKTCFMCLWGHKCLYTQKLQTHKHLHHPHEGSTPRDISICSPFPLQNALKTKRRRDELRMLFQPFSSLDDLITPDCGDAARSALVQGHSLLGPRPSKCVQRRGGQATITSPARCNLITDQPLQNQYNTFIIEW